MKNLLLNFALTIIFVSTVACFLSRSKELNQKELRAIKKRDISNICSVEATSLAEVIAVLLSVKGSKKLSIFLLAGDKILSLGYLIFGFNSKCNNSQSQDEIDRSKMLKQLEDITQKLINLDSIVKCEFLKQKYENIVLKLQRLLNDFKSFHQTNFKNESREQIKMVCKDPSEGINKIYSLFQSIFKETEVEKYMRSCAHFQSDHLNNWSIEIIHISFIFLLTVKGCEEAFDRKTEFNGTQFINEVKQNIEYYEKINMIWFVKDNGNYGLENTVKEILDRGNSAQITANVLHKMFSYFTWDVFFYPSHITSYENHALRSRNDSVLCGSKFYLRSLKHSRNAFIAWCTIELSKYSKLEQWLPNNEKFKNIDPIKQNALNILEFMWEKGWEKNSIPSYILIIRHVNRPWMNECNLGCIDISNGNQLELCTSDSRRFCHKRFGMIDYKRTEKLNIFPINVYRLFIFGAKHLPTIVKLKNPNFNVQLFVFQN